MGLLLLHRPRVQWFIWSLALTTAQGLLALTVVDSEALRVLSAILLGSTAAPIVCKGVKEMFTERTRTVHESM